LKTLLTKEKGIDIVVIAAQKRPIAGSQDLAEIPLKKYHNVKTARIKG